jgi:hypothetical protein
MTHYPSRLRPLRTNQGPASAPPAFVSVFGRIRDLMALDADSARPLHQETLRGSSLAPVLGLECRHDRRLLDRLQADALLRQ